MQVLLSNEEKSFSKDIEIFTSKYLDKNSKIDLKTFWQELYKKQFINKNNSFLKNILLTESICSIDPGIGLFLLTQFSCIEIINTFASKSIKEKHYEDLIPGKKITCFSITEPEAGSDVSMIKTTAKKDDNNWIINGQKTWASNGSISDLIIFFAQTKEHKDKTGVTCFIAESNSKEINISEDIPKLGVKITPSNEIIFNSLRLSKESQIGNIGDGFKIALSTITSGRIYCAAQASGLLKGILRESVNYSTKRNQFGKAIFENQAIQWYLADMSKDSSACNLLLQKAAFLKDSGSEKDINELKKHSSIAKYFCTMSAQKHSSNAVQIHGGQGLKEESFVAKAYRDAKVLEIYEGTNEIQKINLARELKLS